MNSELISWICGEWEDRVCRNYVFDLENWEIWEGGRGSFFFHEIFISATINTLFIYLVYKAKCCDPCMNRRILNCKNQKINTLRRLCPHCRKLCVAKHQFSCSVDGVWESELRWLRPFFVWEQDLEIEFMKCLEGLAFSQDVVYSVCLADVVLSGAKLVASHNSESVVISLKLGWRSWAPSKV